MLQLTQRLLALTLFVLFSAGLQAKTIAEYTAGMQKQAGFFDFYWDDKTGRVLLEVGDFEREFLFLTGLAQGLGSNPVGLDRNQGSDPRLVRFERVGSKALLYQQNLKYRALSDNAAERRAVEEAFASSVLWGFDAVARDGDRLLLDLTPFLLSDQHGISQRLQDTKQGAYRVDGSKSAVYLDRTRNFPLNSEFEARLTFAGSKPGNHVRQVTPTPKLVSLRQHISFVALPEAGYQPRRFHSNSGYFAFQYRDYAAPIDQPLDQRFIYRHRLQKKPGSDEVVEPIVYYVDPGVPEPVRSALVEGARWWADAFEAAGFKDAYRVEILPEDADPMDVRYNVISWVHRSTRGWSYGHALADPRTGEIIKGNVTLGSLRVRQDFLIAQGLLQPYGTENVDTSKLKEMALARIRQLSAHEVGHTLGIAHNFAASPKDRASVMDYPAPLVTLENGNLDIAQAYDAGIGDWDKLAVKYGYGESAGDEAGYLAAVLDEAKQAGHRFISDPDSRAINNAHATSHLWDNGAEPLSEFERMLALRQHALQNFSAAANAPESPRSALEETLVPVYYGHRYQAEAVGKLIGGLDYDYEYNGADAQGFSMVPAARQQKALDLLQQTLSPEFLALPESVLALMPPKSYGYQRTPESFPAYTGVAFDGIALAEAGAGHTLAILLHPERAARLTEQRARRGEAPGFGDLLYQLTRSAMDEGAYTGLQAAIHQRVNHVYVHQLMLLARNSKAAEPVRARASMELAKIQHAIGLMKLFGDDADGYKAHYYYQAQRIAAFLAGDLKVEASEIKPMPPGSPI